MSHVTNTKKMHLCDSESARMTMPNRVKYEIFGKQVFGASDKKPKNQTIPEIFMTLDLHKNNGAEHSQTQDICKILV
jgi:hypothetical protein